MCKILTVKLFILVFLLGLINITVKATPNWNTEESLPTTVRGATIHQYENKLYVIGGEIKQGVVTSSVSIFDFNTNTWTSGASMLNKRAFAASLIINGKIYIFGGNEINGNKWYTLRSVEIYDIHTNTWSTGSSMLEAVGETHAVLIENDVYLFGGSEVVASTQEVLAHNEIQIYNITNETWSLGEQMPFKRYAHSTHLIEDKVYIIGGVNESMKYSPEVNIFDTISKTWTNGAFKTTPVAAASSIVHNNKIYSFGGRYNNTILDVVEIYDIIRNSWNTGPSLPQTLYCSGVYTYKNKAYIAGGSSHLILKLTNSINSLLLPETDNRIFAHLLQGERSQLSINYDLMENLKLTWKSSTPRVASVDNSGYVTALGIGTTYISAYNSNGDLIDYIPVIVTDNDTYRLALHLTVGQKHKLYLKGSDAWSSMDTSVATVSKSGEVTAIKKGLALIENWKNGSKSYIYIRVV